MNPPTLFDSGCRPNTLWVRHGESTWNRAGRMQGQSRWPALTPLGKDQAHKAARDLLDYEPVRILSSDLQRAFGTAKIIAEVTGLPVERSSLLRERHWGGFEGRPVSDGQRAEVGLGRDDPLPGGESRTDVADRLQRVAVELGQGGGPVVVVTHGDVIREAVRLWSMPGSSNPTAANGSITELWIPMRAQRSGNCQGG
ncbi:MAG TPA: histidine phosphatase family protein [Dietzia sp.]|uniref:histidine phosphatase family protein n=1 Tax=Dietzia cinnamea TaxID=321318 RepID=UPI000E88832D|nr:histidine phosphatase family protein [Dietzia sp.]